MSESKPEYQVVAAGNFLHPKTGKLCQMTALRSLENGRYYMEYAEDTLSGETLREVFDKFFQLVDETEVGEEFDGPEQSPN